jgi:hypothetical protein
MRAIQAATVTEQLRRSGGKSAITAATDREIWQHAEPEK